MKKGFYAKLAWTGIRKNKRLYLPYILTCIGMIMMFYIVSFLSTSSILQNMPGGAVMREMLQFGIRVMGFFSLIFLFYTNSFLTRRRKKEFGLYNILGMGKWNLARILAWESLIIAVASLGGGLAAGIIFSKFAELGMINILQAEVNFSMTLEPKAVLNTVILFLIIFVLILFNTLRQIHASNPIELLHSENAGEKPPKANWILALAGVVILGAAYYLAVTIEDPVSALVWFFVAVLMVIAATYLLFIAGSVVVCRLLQKKKKYYYKTNHFVSISSMVYRMKRNGAGLASICILCTMVLVTLSSTVCLYIGAEDSLRTRYPRNITVKAAISDFKTFESDAMDTVRKLSAEVVKNNGLTAGNSMDYKCAMLAGYIKNGRISADDLSALNSFTVDTASDVWQLFVMSVDDYNKLMNQNETLDAGEALLYTTKAEYEKDTIAIGDSDPLKIKKVVPEFIDNDVDAMQILPSMFLFVPDLKECVAPFMESSYENGDQFVTLHWFYGFDMDCEDEIQMEVQSQIKKKLQGLSVSDDKFSVSCESVAKQRGEYYSLYGGLFFLGILLGVVFIFAAVLIMYYKQISEGYEDQSRFEIMQKVGMTKKEIKKSINSQVLTVFFLPLIMAGVHLLFAFPLIHKLLIMFGLLNLKLLIWTTICSFLVFALFYVLVYRITSKAYYNIVSGVKEDTV